MNVLLELPGSEPEDWNGFLRLTESLLQLRSSLD
jgi:hypothetical protein